MASPTPWRARVRTLVVVAALAVTPLAVVSGPPAGAATGATGAGATPTPPPTEPTTPGRSGMYHVWSCRTPTGATAPLDGWVVGPDSTALGTDLSCDADGSFGAWTGRETGAGSAAIEWMTPDGLTPISVVLRRAARSFIDPAAPSASASASLRARYLGTFLFNGMQVPTERTTFEETSVGGSATTSIIGTPGNPSALNSRLAIDPIPTGRDLRPLRIDARCSPAGSPSCDARYQVYSADFRILDAGPPAVDTSAGTLVEALAGPPAPRRGGLGFVVTARDAGSGVRSARVELDGLVASTASLEAIVPSCRAQVASDGLPGYTLLQPCPSGTTLAGQLDTSRWPDGEHQVRLLVDDAAGNVTVAAAGTLLVANDDQVGPGSPLALRGSSNGSPASDAATLTVTWPSTARRASTRPSQVRRCRRPGYAAKHPLTCQGRAAAAETEVRWSPRAQLSGAVLLTTPSGTPIAGATIEVRSTARSSSAQPQVLQRLTTDPGGRATFTLTPGEGSRTLEARWLARTLDTRPAAVGAATLTVRAATTLNAPRRVASGATVTFSGALQGRTGELSKVPVRLEVRDRGRWKTFSTAVTDTGGQWTRTLRFASTRGRYPVRAMIGSTAAYPYAAGQSTRTVTVTVR